MATPQPKAPKLGEAAVDQRPIRPIPRERIRLAAHCVGDMAIITLPDDERIEEGAQDLLVWAEVGEHLSIGQWLIATNDSGGMWRLMRVRMVHGGRASGLRHLELVDIVPPRL